jgi:hypothetical protein
MFDRYSMSRSTLRTSDIDDALIGVKSLGIS